VTSQTTIQGELRRPMPRSGSSVREIEPRRPTILGPGCRARRTVRKFGVSGSDRVSSTESSSAMTVLAALSAVLIAKRARPGALFRLLLLDVGLTRG